jgi:hypothetical protein
MVWLGEIERKLAKLSNTTFTYRSSSNYFMGLVTELFIAKNMWGENLFKDYYESRR